MRNKDLTLPMEELKSICVFRALMLGDMLCAVPALRAIRAAHPAARLSLVALPWARAFAERCDYIDEMIAFPGYPGLPEVPYDADAFPHFLQEVQAHHFDLALQLHGSGRIVNPLVRRFGALRTAGFYDDVSSVLPDEIERYVRWPEQGQEIERLLALTDSLGMSRQGVELEFPLREEDRASLYAMCPALLVHPYVCVHAGSQLPSRRWPAERFAAVADALAEQGYTVVLSGAAAEAPIVEQVMMEMRRPAISLVGRTSLWTLGALIEGAESLVCNDTGVSHIAAALGTPSVVISCGSDTLRWAPLDHNLHRVLWVDKPCRPCSHAVCPEINGCAQAIPVTQVVQATSNKFRMVRV